MKKVMILSAGTATAWHIAQVLRTYYAAHMQLVVCDINPKYLVHTSVLADRFIQVPPIKDEAYYPIMLEQIRTNDIDVLVPLIDDDIMLFPNSNSDLKVLGVKSVAPGYKSVNALSNKEHLAEVLKRIGIRSPQVFADAMQLDTSKQYFVKDCIGCGSKGTAVITGQEAIEAVTQPGKLVQEICYGPEITVDAVFDGEKIYTICRERKEIKLGVSTKCRVYFDGEIQSIMEKLAKEIELPSVFCVQFMKNTRGEWVLTDLNLRSGGGTAISAAVGFQAVRFAAAGWLGLPRELAWLKRPSEEKYVVRTYQEVITQ